MERSRILNQELAHLVAYAVHQPDKMPDLTNQTAEGSAEPTLQEGAQRMRAALLSFKSLKDRQQCQQ